MKNRYFLKYYFLAVILAGIFGYILLQPKKTEVSLNIAPEENNSEIKQKIKPAVAQESVQPEKQNQISSDKIKSKILLDVPFTSQAPLAVWDAVHEEACEEASVVMLKYYLDGKKLNAASAEKEIQSLVAFEIKTRGNYKDTDAQQTADLARDFYGIENLQVVYDFSQEEIKKELSRGNPVIVPAAGRDLKNPFFTSPGPIYHNLVLIGYDGDKIITNDPGTKRGAGYEYNLNVLYNAIHDFPGNLENMEQGRKAMIVVE